MRRERESRTVMNSIWNRNFTILTIGSFISAMGNSAAGFAFGILIYKQTGSPLTLAIFALLQMIPRVATNALVGPFIDRHSRVKIIVGLDFIAAGFFAVIGLILLSNWFDILFFTAVSVLFSVIDTVYQTAYQSLFPDTITPGEHSRAYSISSLIWPIASAIMAPIAAFVVENVAQGVAWLMIFNAITFVIQALFEATMRVNEKLNTKRREIPVSTDGKKVSKHHFIHDLKDAYHYYQHEHGILGIGILFAVFAGVYASHDLLRMPFFVNHSVYTIQHYSFLITAGSIGRMIGGYIQYRFKYPPHLRYRIAVTVYFSVEILGALLLFTPFAVMIVISFIVGFIGVTSFNIRMSATQTYIPPDMRGRINAVQQLMWNLGGASGMFIAALLAEYTTLDYRIIMALFAVGSISAILLIPVRMHKEFKRIYNINI